MAAIALRLNALADPSRQRIVELLAERARSVADLQRHFRFSQPALSKHLRLLKEAGLVMFEKQGRSHLYALNGDALQAPADWLLKLHRFWSERLGTLGELLNEEAGK